MRQPSLLHHPVRGPPGGGAWWSRFGPLLVIGALLVGIVFGRFVLHPAPVAAPQLDLSSSSNPIPLNLEPDLVQVEQERAHAVMTGTKEAEDSSTATTNAGSPTDAAKKVRDPRLAHLLELELTYEATLRSCLSSYCFDEPVNLNGKKQTRIGFLAPPGSGSETLINMLNVGARKDLIATGVIENDTHVPAYGYGKNHGWTRIVRLVRRVVPHALSLLEPSSTTQTAGGAGGSSIPPDLFERQVRQLVRWQCRLTHVAAHTKMLTVFMDDVLLRPMVEVDKILSFIGIRAGRNDLLAAVGQFGKQLQLDLAMHEVNYSPISHLSVAHLDVLPSSLIDAALTSLETEMTSTDTLTRWPCKSFRELESASLKGGVLPVKAVDLAADCSNPKVVCSVGFDKNGG